MDDLGEGNFAKVYRAEAWDICGSIGKSIVAVKELKGKRVEVTCTWIESENTYQSH